MRAGNKGSLGINYFLNHHFIINFIYHKHTYIIRRGEWLFRFIPYEEYCQLYELVTELRAPMTTDELLDELKKLDEVEERNDVYIYSTLRYPPKSTPPTAN